MNQEPIQRSSVSSTFHGALFLIYVVSVLVVVPIIYFLTKSELYKQAYRQRTAVERINSQAVALGIERPHLRNGQAIANQNTLIYLLINLRFLQRLREARTELD